MRAIRTAALLLLVVSAAAACHAGPAPAAADVAAASDREHNSIADSYVQLALALGQHEPSYVDSYFGPPEWTAASPRRAIPDVQAEAEALLERLSRISSEKDEITRLRHSALAKQILALRARAERMAGRPLSAAQEAEALHDAPPAANKNAEAAKLRAALSRLLPAKSAAAPSSLEERYEKYRSGFVVPAEKLEAVLSAAVAEARRRTTAKTTIAMPEGESFRVEYVTSPPRDSFRYAGGYSSVVRVRRDVPFSIDQALDIAAGEGYPGRHVYHVLLEKNLFRDRGWVEFSIHTRPSPRSLIEDGTARCAVQLAFPGGQRTAFERDVLYPLAGLDRSRAAEYAKVRDTAERLADTARPPAEGEYAKDLVRRYLESRGKSMGERWRAFGWLLSSPWTPSDLARASEPNMVPNSSDLTPR